MLIINGARTATKFVDRQTVVRAHRVTFGGRIDGRDKSLDIRVKIGRPNYHEQQFIRDCNAAHEPFPIRKVRLAQFRPRKPVKTKRVGKGKKRA
jgi:hypothetical protein